MHCEYSSTKAHIPLKRFLSFFLGQKALKDKDMQIWSMRLTSKESLNPTKVKEINKKTVFKESLN